MNTTAKLREWVFILCFAGCMSLLYDYLFWDWSRPWVAMIYGLCVGLPIFGFIRGLFLPNLSERLRRLPFPVYAPAMIALCVVFTHLSRVVAGALMRLTGLLPGSFGSQVLHVPLEAILYSLLAAAVLAILMRVSDLIGRDTFIKLLIGRYHRPVKEDRIFLFIDVVGSTRFAERFGDLRAQAFLGRIFASLAEPVQRCRGRIDDYIGDLAMITWPAALGLEQGRCVACIFAIEDEIAKDAESWRAEFGAVPRFRAALHGGPVVTAEIGIDRHKITYFGDTVNSTARIEQLCRSLDSPYLISKELLRRLPTLPAGVAAIDLGTHDVRGRDDKIEVAALVATKHPDDTLLVA